MPIEGFSPALPGRRSRIAIPFETAVGGEFPEQPYIIEVLQTAKGVRRAVRSFENYAGKEAVGKAALARYAEFLGKITANMRNRLNIHIPTEFGNGQNISGKYQSHPKITRFLPG